MYDKQTKTQKRLIKEFPEINDDTAEDIDIKIKTKVLTYQSNNINRDVSEELQEEIKKYIENKNSKKIKKKCNKLANEYLENNRIWMLQENWYCLLAYFITIATMVLRVIDVKTEKINDLISVIMYLAALILWLIIVKTEKLMNWRVERFLIAFNYHAPSMIFISSLLFYLVVYLYTNRCIWIGVIVLSFFACIWLTCLWYKRENKYTTNE